MRKSRRAPRAPRVQGLVRRNTCVEAGRGVLAETHERLTRLADRGHRFSGGSRAGRIWLDGAGYLRRLR
ncbi:hypothetical protein, partial [Nocardia cyriacigeorgica]|uniref:hypothetical protein n=1 Tax=Nocardia cyriacigeorgica TaxID=135487 RepID=UPI003CC80B13